MSDLINLPLNLYTSFIIRAGQYGTSKFTHIGLVCSLFDTTINNLSILWYAVYSLFIVVLVKFTHNRSVYRAEQYDLKSVTFEAKFLHLMLL